MKLGKKTDVKVMRLIVKHNSITIIDKSMTEEEIDFISAMGKPFLVESFNTYIGLDINKYRISDYISKPGEFTLHITTEDLVKLRDLKLNELGL